MHRRGLPGVEHHGTVPLQQFCREADQAGCRVILVVCCSVAVRARLEEPFHVWLPLVRPLIRGRHARKERRRHRLIHDLRNGFINGCAIGTRSKITNRCGISRETLAGWWHGCWRPWIASC